MSSGTRVLGGTRSELFFQDHTMVVNADGSINAVITGTVPISGTVTAVQGTNPWIVAGIATLAYIDDTTTPDITYFGFALPGSGTDDNVWQLFVIDETSGFAKLYANGNSNYNNVWDDRVGYTYS